MKLTVLNFKGGQGKTSIAISLAEHFKLGVIVNEPYSSVGLVLEPDSYFYVKNKLPNADDVVYDFGGGVTQIMLEAIRQSDFVIIPTLPEAADLYVTEQCFKSVKEHVDLGKIIIVANKCKGEDFAKVSAKFQDCKVVQIRPSKAIENIYLKGESIEEQAKKNALSAYTYKRVLEDFKVLFVTIKY